MAGWLVGKLVSWQVGWMLDGLFLEIEHARRSEEVGGLVVGRLVGWLVGVNW